MRMAAQLSMRIWEDLFWLSLLLVLCLGNVALTVMADTTTTTITATVEVRSSITTGLRRVKGATAAIVSEQRQQRRLASLPELQHRQTEERRQQSTTPPPPPPPKVEDETEDYYYPCTYYYGTRKKSKFDKYDDDWYDDCKTTDSDQEQDKLDDEEQDEDEEEELGIGQVTPVPTAPTSQEDNGSSVSAPISPAAAWIDEGADSGGGGDPSQNDVVQTTTRPPHALPPMALSATPPTTSPSTTPTGDDKENSGAQQDDAEGEQQSPPPFQVEEDPKCVAAQAGEVFPTTVNHTVHFQYELVTGRSYDWRSTVWPAVDERFQRFLAQHLVDCTTSGATAAESEGLVHGVSPEPRDSFGTLGNENNSNNNACVNLQGFDAEQYVCDTVTGSVTVYFSEVRYMNYDNITQLQLDVQNEVYKYLQRGINDNDTNNVFDDNGYRQRPLLLRRRKTRESEEFLDPDRGIFGLYFLSQPVDYLTYDGSPGPTLTGSIQNGERGNGDSNLQSASDRNVSPAVAASIAGFTIMTMLIVGFAIHRARRSSDNDNDLGEIAFVKPVETKPTDLSDLYCPDPIHDNDSDNGEDNLPMKTVDTTTESDSFPIQDSPNAFRERRRADNEVETDDGSALADSSYGEPNTTRDRASLSPREMETPDGTSRSLSTPVAPRESTISPNTAHRTMYTVEETKEEDAACYDFSHDGVSMRLTSPDFIIPANTSRTLYSDPPMKEFDRDPPEEEEHSHNRNIHTQELKILSSFLDGRDESPTKRSTEQSPGTPSSEQWTTRTISVGNSASTSALLAAANQILNSDGDSTMTSGATLGISPIKRFDLSLGSSVRPPPSDFSYMSTSPVLVGHNNDGYVGRYEHPELLRSASTTPRKDVSISKWTPNSSGGRSALHARSLSFGSPASVMEWRSHSLSPEDPVGKNSTSSSTRLIKAVTPESSQKLDPPSSAEISRRIRSLDYNSSPDSQESVSSRTEYLKCRRRALEARFQTYKSGLTEVTVRTNESRVSSSEEHRPSSFERTLLIEGEQLRDPAEESSDRRCFDATGEGPPKAGAFPTVQKGRQERRSPVEREERRKGSRTSSRKSPRSRRDYTSLNDIEELLDQDQEWKQSDADESMRIDAFVSSRSRTASLEGMEDGESHFWAEMQTLDDLVSARQYSSRMETRIYPQFQSDTVQL